MDTASATFAYNFWRNLSSAEADMEIMGRKSKGGDESVCHISFGYPSLGGGISWRICKTASIDKSVRIMDHWNSCHYRYQYLCIGLYQLSQIKVCPLSLGGSGFLSEKDDYLKVHS